VAYIQRRHLPRRRCASTGLLAHAQRAYGLQSSDQDSEGTTIREDGRFTNRSVNYLAIIGLGAGLFPGGTFVFHLNTLARAKLEQAEVTTSSPGL